MSLFDIFNSNAQQTGASEATGYPSIGDIQADYVNVDNLVNNRAKSADWGAATGAGVGAILGGPEGAQQGANIGRIAFPILEQAGKKAWGFFNK